MPTMKPPMNNQPTLIEALDAAVMVLDKAAEAFGKILPNGIPGDRVTLTIKSDDLITALLLLNQADSNVKLARKLVG